jgi:hypothetical protein
MQSLPTRSHDNIIMTRSRWAAALAGSSATAAGSPTSVIASASVGAATELATVFNPYDNDSVLESGPQRYVGTIAEEAAGGDDEVGSVRSGRSGSPQQQPAQQPLEPPRRPSSATAASAATPRRGLWIYDSTSSGIRTRIDDRVVWWILLCFLSCAVLSNVIVNNGRLEAERSSADVAVKSLREYASLTTELAKMARALGSFKKVMESSRSHEIIGRALFDDLPPCGCEQRCVPLDWAAAEPGAGGGDYNKDDNDGRGDSPKGVLRDRARRRYFPDSVLQPPTSTTTLVPPRFETTSTTSQRPDVAADEDSIADRNSSSTTMRP